MPKISYSLRAYGADGNGCLFDWEGLDSLPRIQTGDYISSLTLDPHADTGSRHIVVDANYSVMDDEGRKEIALTLRLRPETIFEEGRREDLERKRYAPDGV